MLYRPIDTNLRHWTHDTQIHRATECPPPSDQFFILLNKLFTRVLISFFYACWLFMNEFVNMFLKSMNEIVHTYCNEPNRGRTLC